MTPEEALKTARDDFAGWSLARQANRVLAEEVERLRADLDWSLTHSCGFAEQGQPCGDCEYCHKVEERLRMRIEESTP